MSTKTDRLLLFAIILLGLVLRLYNLERYPLWFDEAAVAMEPRSIFALPPVSAFFNPSFSSDRADYLMLYYHGFMYPWRMLFGDSVFALRISAVLWGILGIGMLYALAARLYNRRVALFSAFLLAIAPFHIYYSQEVRQYTAIMFLSLAAFYLLFEILEQDKGRDWCLWIAVNVVNVYFHYMMLTVLAAQILVFLLYPRRKRSFALKVAGSCFLLFVFLFPLILTVFQKVSYILVHRIRPDISDYPLWGGKIDFMNLAYTLRNFSIGYTVDFYSLQGWTATLFMLFLFLLGLALGRKRNARPVVGYGKKDGRNRVEVWAYPLMRELTISILFAFPIAAIYFFSVVVKPCYVDRYFFPLGALYCLGAAAGIASSHRIPKVIFLLVTVLIFSAGLRSSSRDEIPSSQDQYIGYMKRDTRINQIAGVLAEHYQAGDKIVSSSRMIVLPLKYYTRAYLKTHPAQDSTGLSAEVQEGRLFWMDDAGKPHIIFYNKEMPTRYDRKPFDSQQENGRIWVVNYLFNSYPDVFIELSKSYAIEKHFRFGNAEVFLFVKR